MPSRKIILFFTIFFIPTGIFSYEFEYFWQAAEQKKIIKKLPQPVKYVSQDWLLLKENPLYKINLETWKKGLTAWLNKMPRETCYILLFRTLHALYYLPQLAKNFSEEQLKLFIDNITIIAIALIENKHLDINVQDWRATKNTPLHYVTMLLSAVSAREETIYLYLTHQCTKIIDALLKRNASLHAKNIHAHEFNCNLHKTFKLAKKSILANVFIGIIEQCYQRNVEKLSVDDNSTTTINVTISNTLLQITLRRLTPIEILLCAKPASQEIADLMVDLIKKLLKEENTQGIFFNHQHPSYGEKDLNKTQFLASTPDMQFYFRTQLDKIIPYGVGFPLDDIDFSDITITTEE